MKECQLTAIMGRTADWVNAGWSAVYQVPRTWPPAVLRRGDTHDVEPDCYQASVHPPGLVDLGEGYAEVVGEGVGGGDEVVTGLNLDGSAAAGGL